MEMENEEQLPEAVVEKVSLSEINAELEAIESEDDNALIQKLFDEIATLSDEEKDEMIKYLDDNMADRERRKTEKKNG